MDDPANDPEEKTMSDPANDPEEWVDISNLPDDPAELQRIIREVYHRNQAVRGATLVCVERLRHLLVAAEEDLTRAQRLVAVQEVELRWASEALLAGRGVRRPPHNELVTENTWLLALRFAHMSLPTVESVNLSAYGDLQGLILKGPHTTYTWEARTLETGTITHQQRGRYFPLPFDLPTWTNPMWNRTYTLDGVTHHRDNTELLRYVQDLDRYLRDVQGDPGIVEISIDPELVDESEEGWIHVQVVLHGNGCGQDTEETDQRHHAVLFY